MFVCQTMHKRLRHLLGKDTRQAAGRNVVLFEYICQCQGIYHCAEHTHVVCRYTANAMPGNLRTTHKIPTTDHNYYLCAICGDFFDLFRQPTSQFGIYATIELAR